jgi:phage terminase large subunit
MSGMFCVCAREIASAIDASSKKLIDDTIFRHGIQPAFKISESEVIHIPTGGRIHFKGLKGGSKAETRTRLRSLEGVDVLWVEEAQSLTTETLTDIDETIRGLNSAGKSRKIIYTLNPYDSPDAVFSFYEGIPSLLKLECNICDNFFAPADRVVKSKALKEKDPLLWAHVYGGKPNTIGDRAVISIEQFNSCVSRAWNGNEQEVIGIDVGRMGDDRTVMARRRGNALLEYKTRRKQTLDVTFNDIKQFVKHKHIPIRIDSTGLAGLEDFLRRDGWNVNGINFAYKANDAKYGSGAGSIINEMWFGFADKIETINLPLDNDLRYELTTRQYSYDKFGLRKIQTKDEYKKHAGKSPDIADAVILAFYDVFRRPVHYYL